MQSTSVLFNLGTGIQMLGLALMIGGMLSIGAFAAPVIFKQVARPEAGDILTTIFRRYDKVLVIALIFVVLGEAFRVLSVQTAWTTLPLVREVVLVVTVLLLAYSLFGVNAKLEAMHKAGVGYGATAEGQEFLKVHKLSESLFKTEMMGAVIIMLLTPFV